MTKPIQKFIDMYKRGITPKAIQDCKNEIGLEFLADEYGYSIKDCHDARRHYGINYRNRDRHQSR